MAFDFPDLPVVGDEFVSGGATYTWTGLVWDLGSSATIADKVDKAGDTMTGNLTLTSADPAITFNSANSGGLYFNSSANALRYRIVVTDQNFLINAGGTGNTIDIARNGNVKFNYNINPKAGIHWDNTSNVTGQHDLSKGLCLYGYGSTSQFGFNITSGTLNYIVQNDGNKHNFIVGTSNRLQINNVGLTQPTVTDGKNGYFIGDRWHGMYFHGGNKLVFTEYHDHFNWRRQTSGSAFGGDQRMTLIGGNLDAAGTVSTRAVIDRSMLETRPDLESFVAGEDPADSEIPQRGINLGKLLLHALDRIAELEARIKRFEDL